MTANSNNNSGGNTYTIIPTSTGNISTNTINNGFIPASTGSVSANTINNDFFNSGTSPRDWEDYQRYVKALSMDEKGTGIRRAFYDDVSPGWEWWICCILEGHVIVTDGAGMFWAYPYSFSGVKVSFGEPVEVERQFIFMNGDNPGTEAKATEVDETESTEEEAGGKGFDDVPEQEGSGNGQGFSTAEEEVQHAKSLVLGGEGNVLRRLNKKSTDDEIVVGNYMFLFGDNDSSDLEAEYFTANTNWKSEYTEGVGRIPMDWEHGNGHQDSIGPEGMIETPNRHDILGYVDVKSAEIDEKGLWVERVLNRHNRYIKHVQLLLDAGVLGTSTEPIQQKVVKAKSGEILEWPLYRDSLTVSPVEWRMSELGGNVLGAMKAIADVEPLFKELCEAKGIVLEEDEVDKGETMGLSRQRDVLKARIASIRMRL